MIDVDEVRAARARARQVAAAAPPPRSADAWQFVYTSQLHHRWLALWRGDGWTFERIAELDGVDAETVRGAVEALVAEEIRR